MKRSNGVNGGSCSPSGSDKNATYEVSFWCGGHRTKDSTITVVVSLDEIRRYALECIRGLIDSRSQDLVGAVRFQSGHVSLAIPFTAEDTKSFVIEKARAHKDFPQEARDLGSDVEIRVAKLLV
ncbi:MAG: hypothetical protein WC640_00965 [Candidatus Paceibacterota bacterium]